MFNRWLVRWALLFGPAAVAAGIIAWNSYHGLHATPAVKQNILHVTIRFIVPVIALVAGPVAALAQFVRCPLWVLPLVSLASFGAFGLWMRFGVH